MGFQQKRSVVNNFLAARVRSLNPRQVIRALQPIPSQDMRVLTGHEQVYAPAENLGPGGDHALPADYPQTLPTHQEAVLNLDTDFTAAQLAQGAAVIDLMIPAGTAADRFRIDWEFETRESEDLFVISININGEPFLNRNFLKPYRDMQEFFRKMDTSSTLQLIVQLAPGAVIVPPMGRISAHVIIDTYRSKYLG